MKEENLKEKRERGREKERVRRRRGVKWKTK